MAARVAHSSRSGLSSGLDCFGVPHNTQRRVRATSQTRATSNNCNSPRPNAGKARSASVQRVPLFRAATTQSLTARGPRTALSKTGASNPSSPLVTRAGKANPSATPSKATQNNTKVTTPVRPNRGPIVPSPRKASAPSKLVSDNSSLARGSSNSNNSGSHTVKSTPSKAPEISSSCDPDSRAVGSSPGRSYKRGAQHSIARSGRVPNSVAVRRKPTPHSNVYLAENPDFCIAPCDCHCSSECLRCVSDSNHRSEATVDTFTTATEDFNRHCSRKTSSSSSTDHGNDSNSSKGSLSSSDGSELSSSNASSDSGCSELRVTRKNNSNSSPRRTVTTATLTSKSRKVTAPVISENKIRNQSARSPYARSVSQPTSYNSERKLLRAENELKPDDIRTSNRETLKARGGYRINVNGYDLKTSLKELDKLGLHATSNGHLQGSAPALRNGVTSHLLSSPGAQSPGPLDQSDKFEHEAGFLDDLPGGADGITDSPVASSAVVRPTILRISKDHGGSKSNQGSELDPAAASSGEVRKLSAPSVLPAKRGHGRDADGACPADSNASQKKDEKSFKPVKFKKMSTTAQKDATEFIPEEQEAMEVTTACTVQSVSVPAVEVQSVTPLKSCPPQTIVVSARSGSSTFYDKVNSSEQTSKSESTPVSAMITINSVVPQLSSTATPAVDAKNAVLDNTKHSLVVEPIAPARRNSKCSKEDEKTVQPQKKTGESASSVSIEPVKSVSITKLESDVKGEVPKLDEVVKKETNASAEKVVAKVERKISPVKNYWLDSDVSISTPAAKSTPVVAQVKKEAEPSTTGAATSDPSRKVSAEAKKSTKKDTAAFSDELNAEENAKYAQEKVARLEKMVSDLVKNAEIKKQEIAALKMQIKRLKELVRERGQASDEDPKSAAKKKGPAAPSSTTNGASGSNNDASTAATTATPAVAAANATAAAPPGANERLEELVEENRVLRSQLLHLGGSLNSSRLSDQEREALLKGGSWGERSTTGATIGDWDNKSSSSEVSVACLQDRIMQMEETHYCTNEELQATLQELDDLREQLAESQAELENMQEEKQVLLASLTQQTNFLSESREQNQTLKQLLIQQSENSQAISSCVNSQKLLELLKSVEEDHERLEMKQEDVEAQLAAAKVAEHRFLQDSQMYRDRMKSLEGLLECSSAAKAAAEAQSAELQEAVKAEKLESARLQEALTAAKEHMAELEARLVGGGSVSEVLEAVRAENSKLEARVAELTQQLHAASRDSDKMKELVSSLQDKLKHAEESARDGLHDASARSERLQEERRALLQQVASAEKALADAKQTAQRHLQHKRELKTALSESQKLLTQAQQDKQHCEELNQQQKQQFDKQVEEWEQFQCDLLTTVRVANDFKTEVQSQLEKVQQENAVLKHQLATLEKKAANCRVCSGASKFMSSPGGTVDKRNADRALTRTDSKVKSLIESLENGIPITRGSSRSSTNSCLDSTSASSVRKTVAPAAPLLKRADTDGVIRSSSVASPLKESGNIEPGSPVSPLRSLQRSSLGEGLGSLSSSSPSSKVNVGPPSSPTANLPDTVKMSQLGEKAGAKLIADAAKPISILSNKMETRKSSFNQLGTDKKDPLSMLAQGGGSRRNALLKWCQNQTLGYSQVDITNFSSSWSDGLALCAILDTYVPEKINYRTLNHADKRANFEKALAAAESVGIPSTLDVNDMMNSERPNWQTVYNYVTSIYAHFET